MRTAFTIAKTHKGDWEIISSPDAAIQEQKIEMRKLKGQRAHSKYCRLVYQESDGLAENINFLTPSEDEARLKDLESQNKSIATFGELSKTDELASQKELDAKRDQQTIKPAKQSKSKTP